MSTVFHDSEELSQALRHTNVSAMQTSRGKFRAVLSQAALNGWSLQFLHFQEGSSVCAGDAPRDEYAFLIPLTRAPNCRLLGQEVSERSIGIYAPGSEHVDTTTQGCKEVVIVASKNWLERSSEDGVSLPGSGSNLVNTDLAALERLRDVLQAVPMSGALSPEAERGFGDALHVALADAVRSAPRASVESGPGRPRMPRAQILRAISELLEAQQSEPIHAGELAATVGVSQPSLQRVFHEWFGMPPARYLTMRRLNLARKRLREDRSASVTEVAGALGFWDLSRFAKCYKSLFDELPSQTLRKPSLRG